MSRCCNCINPFPLGCLDSCGNIDLGIDAKVSGEYTLDVSFCGVSIQKNKDFKAGENIVFDLCGLNRCFKFTAKLYDSNNEQITIESQGKIYDCVEFQTIIVKKIDC